MLTASMYYNVVVKLKIFIYSNVLINELKLINVLIVIYMTIKSNINSHVYHCIPTRWATNKGYNVSASA